MKALKRANNELEVQCQKMKEEVNVYKGRMVNLTRDVELSQSYLTKVNSEANMHSEQFNYMKDRVNNLETDLERAIKEKTDAIFEIKRLEG